MDNEQWLLYYLVGQVGQVICYIEQQVNVNLLIVVKLLHLGVGTTGPGGILRWLQKENLVGNCIPICAFQVLFTIQTS